MGPFAALSAPGKNRAAAVCANSRGVLFFRQRAPGRRSGVTATDHMDLSREGEGKRLRREDDLSENGRVAPLWPRYTAVKRARGLIFLREREALPGRFAEVPGGGVRYPEPGRLDRRLRRDTKIDSVARLGELPGERGKRRSRGDCAQKGQGSAEDAVRVVGAVAGVRHIEHMLGAGE